jgi:hypothetical protein
MNLPCHTPQNSVIICLGWVASVNNHHEQTNAAMHPSQQDQLDNGFLVTQALERESYHPTLQICNNELAYSSQEGIFGLPSRYG